MWPHYPVNLYLILLILDNVFQSRGIPTVSHSTTSFSTRSYAVVRDVTRQPGISGDVIIDDNGDRDTSYSIQDMDSVTGDFRVVANYWGDRPKYNPVDGVEIHWPITGIPPKNTPRCGFDGLDPVCNERGPLPLYAIIMIVFIVLIVIVAVIAYIIYRKLRLESELNNMSWRVSYDDIKMTDRINGSIASSRNALRSSFISNDESGTEVGEQSFAKIGIYKGTVVAIKQTKREKIRVTRDVLIEVKTVRDMAHDNITRFVGASLDPNKICILTEYCNKGSLQDLLANDSIKLDWSFRLSLLQDLVRGMVFVHNSDLKSHGRLRSSNCVVDSRFILKITDFGLHSFYGDEADDEKNHAYKEKLLWQAPELVRMKSSLSAGSAAGDVYSFGIILHEMSSRDQPYFVERCVLEVEDIIDRIVALQDPPFRPKTPHEGVPDGFLELMQKCWSEIPENRPDFNGISVVLRKLMSGRGGGKNIMDTLLQRMEQYATNLEGIVHERTQQLVCEQKKSEELLNQILPSSIAGQLKLGKAVEPESFDCVTIFFSDIVGFTKMSSESTPLQVVNFLNDLYTAFDAIIDQYDVYKVETIGDAYMVVSGLPISNGQNHAVEIARMSLALLDFIKGFKIKHRPDDQLQLRIGIHSGSCVAGVVGLKMPRYCLFGDTVNMTSRMESNGQALKIHVSPFTKDILDGFGTFTLELRGEIEMKGKGAVTTYWLLGETVKPPTP